MKQTPSILTETTPETTARSARAERATERERARAAWNVGAARERENETHEEGLRRAVWLRGRCLPFDLGRWKQLRERIRREAPSLSDEAISGLFELAYNLMEEPFKRADARLRDCIGKALVKMAPSLATAFDAPRVAERFLRHAAIGEMPNLKRVLVKGRLTRAPLSESEIGDDAPREALEFLREPEAWDCIVPPKGRVIVHASFPDAALRAAAALTADKELQKYFSSESEMVALVRICMDAIGVAVPAPERFAHAVTEGLVFGKEPYGPWGGVAEAYGLVNGTERFVEIRRRILRQFPTVWKALDDRGERPRLLEEVVRVEDRAYRALLEMLYQSTSICPSAIPVLLRRHEMLFEVDINEAEGFRRWMFEVVSLVQSEFFYPSRGGAAVHVIWPESDRK